MKVNSTMLIKTIQLKVVEYNYNLLNKADTAEKLLRGDDFKCIMKLEMCSVFINNFTNLKHE